MATLFHLKKEDQELMPLFNQAFLENKPIPFPNRSGTQAYSNLFYWAHLEAFETAEFPLHPHKGFEIMTFVFEGSLEHYDTASKEYTPVNAGGVQVTQAGSGVEHSEKIIKGSHLFQIWFDPDFSKTLQKDASYKDYVSEDFSVQTHNGISRLTYVGEKGPIYCETPGLGIEKLNFDAGSYRESLDKDAIYSCYLLNGEISINDEAIVKDGFVKIENEDSVTFTVSASAELFVIKSPVKVGYSKFIDRY